jgi:cystathionine beta-lyase
LDEDKRHIPLATIRPEFAEQTITLMSPSKTFNLAGIGCAFAVIPNQDLRRVFVKALKGIVPHVNALGYTACLAAYQAGEPWRQALLDYLRRNRDSVMQEIDQIDGLAVSHIEATYLAWIDTRATGIENPGQFFEEAGVDLWDGVDFGGPGFVRLNFGCPHSLLQEGLARIRQAMDA